MGFNLYCYGFMQYYDERTRCSLGLWQVLVLTYAGSILDSKNPCCIWAWLACSSITAFPLELEAGCVSEVCSCLRSLRRHLFLRVWFCKPQVDRAMFTTFTQPFRTQKLRLPQTLKVVLSTPLTSSTFIQNTFRSTSTVAKSLPVVVFQNADIYRYGQTIEPLFKNLTWTLREGEIWAIVGPVGSGKSTLAQVSTNDPRKTFSVHIHIHIETRIRL